MQKIVPYKWHFAIMLLFSMSNVFIRIFVPHFLSAISASFSYNFKQLPSFYEGVSI